MDIKGIITFIIQLLIWAFIGRAIISWLVVAGVKNPLVFQINYSLSIITEPIVKPLRRFIPPLGSMDITPFVAILGLIVIRSIIFSLL